jgi:hypothetical protein
MCKNEEQQQFIFVAGQTQNDVASVEDSMVASHKAKQL